MKLTQQLLFNFSLNHPLESAAVTFVVTLGWSPNFPNKKVPNFLLMRTTHIQIPYYICHIIILYDIFGGFIKV